MTNSVSGLTPLFASLLFLLSAPCHASDCKTETVSAPVLVAVGGWDCEQKVEVKVCAPAGKKVKSSAVTDLSPALNIALKKELKKAGEGCVEAEVGVQSTSSSWLSFLQYCEDASYTGKLELVYCR